MPGHGTGGGAAGGEKTEAAVRGRAVAVAVAAQRRRLSVWWGRGRISEGEGGDAAAANLKRPRVVAAAAATATATLPKPPKPLITTEPPLARPAIPVLGELRVVHVAPACFVVVDKPSGLLSVPGRAEDNRDCVVSRLQESMGFPTAKVAHRLDLETSGLMVLGLTAEAHANLSTQFQDRVVEKEYVALVWGAGPAADADEGRVELPMRYDPPTRPRHVVDHAAGKPALTLWRVEERFADHARVRLTPHTGRSHQLRVHMNELGCPILGDSLYGSPASLAARDRLCLHAAVLAFRHPATGDVVRFESDVPFR